MMDREKLFVLWLMGPTSSGKTTIAEAFYNRLIMDNIPVVHYDGDEFRDLFGSSLNFRKEDRMRVVKALVHFSNKSIKSGLRVIVSALTAHPDARSYVAENVSNLITGYVKCPIEVCARRDPKGLYALAMQGSIDTLIGYNTSYPPPDNPDIILDAEANPPEANAEQIRKYLLQKGYLV